MLGVKSCEICPFRDIHKSGLHMDKNGKLINPKGQTFCKAINNWVVKETPCEGEAVLGGERYNVRCKNCNRIVAQVSILKDKKKTVYNLVYTENLDSKRTRPDGLIGLECGCGQYTLLSDSPKDDQVKAQYLRGVSQRVSSILKGKEKELFEEFLVKARVTNDKEAHWNEPLSKFIIEKEVK